MHDEWAGFLDRMTMSAKDLARDPSQAAALSKAQLDAAKAFRYKRHLSIKKYSGLFLASFL
jgi:hypothetical protein